MSTTISFRIRGDGVLSFKFPPTTMPTREGDGVSGAGSRTRSQDQHLQVVVVASDDAPGAIVT